MAKNLCSAVGAPKRNWCFLQKWNIGKLKDCWSAQQERIPYSLPLSHFLFSEGGLIFHVLMEVEAFRVSASNPSKKITAILGRTKWSPFGWTRQSKGLPLVKRGERSKEKKNLIKHPSSQVPSTAWMAREALDGCSKVMYADAVGGLLLSALCDVCTFLLFTITLMIFPYWPK